jgi:hypothetical protein
MRMVYGMRESLQKQKDKMKTKIMKKEIERSRQFCGITTMSDFLQKIDEELDKGGLSYFNLYTLGIMICAIEDRLNIYNEFCSSESEMARKIKLKIFKKGG